MDAEAIELVADEVARIARTAMSAIERISRTSHDQAAVQAAKLSLGAVLLAATVASEAELETVNAIWAGRWRMERTH